MRVILAVVGQEVRGLIKNMRHILILLGLILFLLVIGFHWIVSLKRFLYTRNEYDKKHLLPMFFQNIVFVNPENFRIFAPFR